MDKRKNLCFENDPDVIGDIMNGCSDLKQSDCVEAIIGLSRIIARQGAAIRVLKENNSCIEKNIIKLEGGSFRMKNDIAQVKRKVKNDSEMDTKFTVDEMNMIMNKIVSEAEESGNDALKYKMERMSLLIDGALKRHGGKKENMNIVTVIW